MLPHTNIEMTEVFCNTCGKVFKNPGSLASHRYKIHKTAKYKSYRNHKECNDNGNYVSKSRDLDEIEDGLAKLRNEVAIALVNVKETVEDIHGNIRFLWEQISRLAEEY